MKFVHFGDLHLWSPRMLWREWYEPKRWLGRLNLTLGRAKKFPPGYRLPAINAVTGENADVALFTGDFTNFSLREEFVMAAALFEPVLEKTRGNLIAIPGNHDRYTRGSVEEGLLEHFLTFLPPEPVHVRKLGIRLSVVCVDHAVPLKFSSNGVIHDDVHQKLVDTLEKMRKTNQIVILMGHFPYTTPPEHPESREHKLIGEEKLEALVKEYKPALYVHGHKHVRWAYRAPETPETLCLNCGSVAMKNPNPAKQAGYLTWDMDENNGKIKNLTAKVYDGNSQWTATPLLEDA